MDKQAFLMAYAAMNPRTKYYDINTNPLEDHTEWAIYRESLVEKKQEIIGQDTVGDYVVSTVYVGLDMGMFTMEPLIFETMVFGKDKPWDMWQKRYAFKRDAEYWHKMIVYALQNGRMNEIDGQIKT